MDRDKLAKSTTTSGRPPAPGFENASAPEPIDPASGMHTSYWVLSEEERAKGFIRPVRRAYIHVKCGVETVMSLPLAETYARDPKYYGATFCVACSNHFPVREYQWSDTDITLGE